MIYREWILSIMFITALLNAQSQLQPALIEPNFIDVRSIGMGGTGVAGAKGSSSLFLNPALIGALDKISITGGVRMNFGTIQDEYIEDLYKLNNGKYETGFLPNVKLNHLSFGIPFIIPKSPVTIGIGIGYHTGYDFSRTQSFDTKTVTSEIKEKHKFRGGLHTISPNIAIGIKEMFFAGISFHKSIASKATLIVESEKKYLNTLDKYEEEYSANGNAFYVSFGAAVRPIPNLSIGMGVTPKFEWEFEDFEYLYEDDSVVIEQESSMETEFTIPTHFSFGIEYQVIPQLIFAAEYQSRAFNNMEIDGDDIDIDNGFCFRFGTEVIAGVVPIRVGFFAQSVASGDVDSVNDYTDDKPITVLGATCGVGVPIQMVSLDLGFQWNHYKQEIRDYALMGIGTKYYERSANRFRVDLGISVDIKAPKLNKGSSVGVSQPASKAVVTTPSPQATPSSNPVQTTPSVKTSSQSVPVTQPVQTTPTVTTNSPTTPVTQPVQSTPAITVNYDSVQSPQPTEKLTEDSWDFPSSSSALKTPEANATTQTSQSLTIGSEVRIITNTDKEFKGVLVEESTDAYLLDINGNKITLYKDVVKTIE